MKPIGQLVLLGLLSLVEGELSVNFTNCRQYFVNNNAPTIFQDQRYREICQRFGQSTSNYRNYRYATLYDTLNRIPVYSAYVYRGQACGMPRPSTWMIEPQLDNRTDVNMETQSAANLTGPLPHQAVNGDYEGQGHNGLQRGHLYPRSHNMNRYQSLSTYTLTNSAPKRGEDNRAWYRQVEEPMANYIDKNCSNNFTYIVTGVVPGNNNMNNRVNIPAYFWSAVCCEDKTKTGYYISAAYIMQMGMRDQAGNRTVSQLNDELPKLYKQQFTVFGQHAGCS